ncbi:hypothetical protein EDB19DRAFT_1832814 [Suillus lakei]|nr:hypothetical protein EDB19DRAFT_1832814 [Suillus lakei]
MSMPVVPILRNGISYRTSGGTGTIQIYLICVTQPENDPYKLSTALLDLYFGMRQLVRPWFDNDWGEISLHNVVSKNASKLEDCNPFSKLESAGRTQEMQTFMMSLDGIAMSQDEQDMLFTQYTVDMVISSYLAAQNRVRQYTQLLKLLRHEEDEWAEKVLKASHVMPDYQPLLSLLPGVQG